MPLRSRERTPARLRRPQTSARYGRRENGSHPPSRRGSAQLCRQMARKPLKFLQSESRGEFLISRDWRSERNWDPTFSEFLALISLGREELGSNSLHLKPRLGPMSVAAAR